MTKISKVLVVIVFFASAGFLGIAGASFATRTDWKTKSAEYPAKIQLQTAELAQLDQSIQSTQNRMKDAVDTIKVDLVAMETRHKDLAAQLEKLSLEISQQTAAVSAETAKAQTTRETAAQRREDAITLRNQYEALRADKESALREVKRLTDLLRQATENLKTVSRRNELLQSDLPKGYDK